MTIETLRQQIERKLAACRRYANNDVYTAIGEEAVAEFKENFENESFDGNNWQDVKRRDPDSPWYGHSGQSRKFSESRTNSKILDGETGELKNAISFRTEPNKVIVKNEKPYAIVHNEGRMAKIYGKTPFQMPKRQFIGATPKLINRINSKIVRDMTTIIQSP